MDNLIYATITEHIYDSDGKQPVISVFLDLQKAFDTVCHRLLLNKLDNYGFRAYGLKPLKYLKTT